MLQGKKILIGISGSIAAYKTILLVRLLVKAGAEVKVVMTTAAKEFVSPLLLATLSKNKVLVDLASEDEWANHVQLGRWADVFIIAPLSCNTLAKMAYGLCDNLLMAVYLSATCKVVVAPAMDEDMWHHGATQRNLGIIKSYGNLIIPVGNGELASGLVGEGRMAEPEEIIRFVTENIFRTNALSGKKVLITAGPTYEPIDPVRFIGNHSSGKMGFAIAEAFYEQGAEVYLVSGPTNETIKYTGIEYIPVNTAADMYTACLEHFSTMDIGIFSAAVADYTPVEVASEKIKKKEDHFSVALQKTTDILAEAGKQKKANQLIVGFALETENELANAADKLYRKNADAIVLNSLRVQGAGFRNNTNQITIINKKGEKLESELASKKDIANQIVSYVITQLYES
ncbi:MAG: bifunctional phosphopantothenoylcysteine decarboxylase/phosphopantothenate--cysteine ligase CoaBC [Chitinophagaceae bacterium]|nr:bifunctional phosphopantothenoylcysteine decarboxylase/phosphopantothenate--cysteine ligase CoaBC [Chitinophagaceae bacterium]